MLERKEQHFNSWKLGTISRKKKINKFEKDKTHPLCSPLKLWRQNRVRLGSLDGFGVRAKYAREKRAWSWPLSLISAASTFIPYSYNPFLILPQTQLN
jgi:hypothetical protein